MACTLEIEPGRLANYLQVVVAQRKRMAQKMLIDYGNASDAYLQLVGDVSEVQALVNECVRLQAAVPKASKPRGA